jgi:hypothetical protein
MGEWRKSSYSGANGGDCTEVASAGVVMVSDTTYRGGGVRLRDRAFQHGLCAAPLASA